MSKSPNHFIDLCIRHHILTFGEFTLKSGRVSPYFFNAGLFSDGLLLYELASEYAKLVRQIMAESPGQYMLYGPAYKGIPLAAACAVALALKYKKENHIHYAFNRKESKDHGEGGDIVGAKLRGKVIIIDDVITAGTSVEESVRIIRAAGAEPVAVVIALDREEVAGDTGLSAVQAVEATHGIPVHPIIRLTDLVEHLAGREELTAHASAVAAYRAHYGISSG
ncbi:MAG: orotate phosphoribosyltransferase [Gammaproteobacteria bacterium]|nr:orotate phosphoribosyltransferase [Gammaproteobacteria bacterium]MDE0279849.1 orotate phosphoribosyltransferase [Gammaproteobacteria bacterium]MXY65139.1 orotate phosphoribosyltransferase [Gammaproteobacteria bacterium]MYG68276.1 orotate phosphoribosyltransferase [Gammaproteobacteria bacterium]MYH90653.1 orotate phosphoribosyltransferase [Gammaproteobacteria bacterium]